MNAKKIKCFRHSLKIKNSISFSHIKFLFSLFFSQKMMEFWSFFLSCFWGPQNLLGPSKTTQLLDSWPLGMLLKSRPWGRLLRKKCPVPIEPASHQSQMGDASLILQRHYHILDSYHSFKKTYFHIVSTFIRMNFSWISRHSGQKFH